MLNYDQWKGLFSFNFMSMLFNSLHFIHVLIYIHFRRSNIFSMMKPNIKRTLNNLKSTPEYIKCRQSLQNLKSLLIGSKLLAEYELLKQMYLKIAIRLRNSPYSRSIEQLYRLTRKATIERDALLSDDFRRLLDHFNNAETRLERYCINVEQFANIMWKMATIAKRLFHLAQIWLDLGQLFIHFLIVSCLASRICIYSKAILVYLYDVYRFLLIAHDHSHGKARTDHLRHYFYRLNIRLVNNKAKLKKDKKTKETKTKEGVTLTKDNQPKQSLLFEDTSSFDLSMVKVEDIGVPLERKDNGTIGRKGKKRKKNADRGEQRQQSTKKLNKNNKNNKNNSKIYNKFKII